MLTSERTILLHTFWFIVFFFSPFYDFPRAILGFLMIGLQAGDHLVRMRAKKLGWSQAKKYLELRALGMTVMISVAFHTTSGVPLVIERHQLGHLRFLLYACVVLLGIVTGMFIQRMCFSLLPNKLPAKTKKRSVRKKRR